MLSTYSHSVSMASCRPILARSLVSGGSSSPISPIVAGSTSVSMYPGSPPQVVLPARPPHVARIGVSVCGVSVFHLCDSWNMRAYMFVDMAVIGPNRPSQR